MATSIDLSSGSTTPTPPIQQQHQQMFFQPSHQPQQQAPSSPQFIYAPLPTRRMLSQLLRQWQQAYTQPSPSISPISPIKEYPSTIKEPLSSADSSVTPQPSRTPSRLVISQQYTPTSTSPHLTLTTPTHTRRPSLTTFLPSESLLMSPIPRARNPGGFRPTSSGSIEAEGVFGEVVGIVGGWE